jgi:hypothetical protein
MATTKTLDKPITIENARIGFKNFSGKAGKFNPVGKRNFCVFLDPQLAEELEREGWNIKWLKPRDPLDADQAILKVNVNFTGPKPPKVELITSRNKTRLNEGTVNILDWADIATVDVIFTPYNYEFGGREGISAYLKAIYVTTVEDAFEAKYVDVPDAANNIQADDD